MIVCGERVMRERVIPNLSNSTKRALVFGHGFAASTCSLLVVFVILNYVL